MVNLKLTGRSGCDLEIIEKSNEFLVRKTSKKTTYNQRLILQAKKQKAFINDSFFLAPKVFSIIDDETTSFFDMEYVAGEKYSDYLVRISKQELDRFIDSIISYIDNNLANSIIKKADQDIFINKALALKKELGDSNKQINILLDQLIKKTPFTPVPHGGCHGDLTFSNMIFSGEKVYFIDFLDSFFDSPLIDIVKLRQDTCFYWTLLIDTELEAYKKSKMLQIMKYFDGRLYQVFEKHNYFLPWYNYLQCFNLLRILPYINHKHENELVINALNTIKL